MLPSGADHAFECVGRVELIRAAIDSLDRHGQAILLGVPPATAEATFLVSSMYLDKSILGCRYGSSAPSGTSRSTPGSTVKDVCSWTSW